MNLIQRFIAKLFRIKTGMIYDPETMGLPIKPGTILHNNYFFVKNNSDTTIYIANMPRAFPEKIKVTKS